MVSLYGNPAYLSLRVGQAVSALGSQVTAIALPLVVLALTDSPAQAGLVAFLSTLPNFLFSLPAGVLVDRWDRRWVMIVCDVGRAAATGLVGVLLWLGSPSLLQLGLLAFAESSLAVFYNLAQSAAVARLVPAPDLPEAVGHGSAISTGSFLIGQPLGGLLYSAGRAIPFVADAASYLFSVVSLLFLKGPFRAEPSALAGDLKAEVWQGIRWLWAQPFLRLAHLLIAGSNLVFAGNYLVLIVLAGQRQASPAAIGMMFSAGGVGGLLGSILASWLQKRLTMRQVVTGVHWLWAALLPLYLIAPGTVGLGAVYGAIAFLGPIWNVVLTSYQIAVTPDELRGRVGSVIRLVTSSVIPLGAAAAGILLQATGAVTTVVAMSVWMLTLAVTATWSPDIKRGVAAAA